MGQTRLFVTLPSHDARRAFPILEAEFEEDGFPLAVCERDEAAHIDEIELYVEEDIEAAEARLRKLLSGLGLTQAIEREILPDIDWVAHSLAGLKPVRSGRVLVHGRHDRPLRRPGDIAIEIEAGLAFGTGHHGTTLGCLDMLQRILAAEAPRNALDLGTGTAVLAIAIARLARIPVLATDIDPVATHVAAENVRQNGVAGLVATATATGFAHRLFAERGPFDLIVANILARPLMALAPQMAARIAPGGALVLSGILAGQRQAVLAAYVGQKFRHVRTLWREGWVTIHLRR